MNDTATGGLSERAIVAVVGAVQFVNILDFMIVMPLGPDFAEALGIPVSSLGLIGGSYTAAASVAGLVGSLFLDRYGRRAALAVAMLGLVIGTAAGGFATSLGGLVAARILAGSFGGPATSLAMSIIADVIPAQRRGKAMGAVMGAFAAASVLGVPAGLELSRRGGWRLPFFAVAGVGLVVMLAARSLLPPLRGHIEAAKADTGTLADLFRSTLVQLSYLMTMCAMMGGFILVPNISAFTQYNLGYPRERLGLLYLAGGAASFGTMRIAGWLVDRVGAARTGYGATAVLLSIIWFGFGFPREIPVMLLFVGFMVAMSTRNVAYNTITSRVPGVAERARFMSMQSAVAHLASALGAFLSAKLLTEGPDKKLHGMETVAVASIGLMAMVPVMMAFVEARVRRRDASATPAATSGGPSGSGSTDPACDDPPTSAPASGPHS
jgi:predicted MFS family arabinose efflux permease